MWGGAMPVRRERSALVSFFEAITALIFFGSSGISVQLSDYPFGRWRRVGFGVPKFAYLLMSATGQPRAIAIFWMASIG